MRILTIDEANFVSGASTSPDTDKQELIFMGQIGIVLGYAGISAELVFAGYCGHHIASNTGIVNPVVGTILGITAPILALTAPAWSQKIYHHFSK